MNGISMGTALEIFTNPKDLVIAVCKADIGDMYSFLVTRGPGHGYKLLISTLTVFTSTEAAAKEAKAMLKSLAETVGGPLDNPSTPGGLNTETIAWIISELEAGRAADTSTMPRAAA